MHSSTAQEGGRGGKRGAVGGLVSHHGFLGIYTLTNSTTTLSTYNNGSANDNSSTTTTISIANTIAFPLSRGIAFANVADFPINDRPRPGGHAVFGHLRRRAGIRVS